MGHQTVSWHSRDERQLCEARTHAPLLFLRVFGVVVGARPPSSGHTLDEFDPGPTGRVELSVDIDGSPRGFGGPITVWQPEQELSFANNWHPPHAWPVPTQITFRLTPLYDGTRVELFHHGFERLGAQAADEHEGYEGAWDLRHLKELKRLVEAGA